MGSLLSQQETCLDSDSLKDISTDPAGNTMDAVPLSFQDRKIQRMYEAEISYGGEADLHRHYDSCGKNPGHRKFIAVDTFNEHHLPESCRDEDLVDCIRALSDITVRVSVKYVSDRRPKTCPGSDKPYPCYIYRGRDMMRVGSGWISGVDKKKNKASCKCTECLISPMPKIRYAVIRIRTAAHVVFDELEGAYTTCHLFYDKGGTPAACSGVLELSGMSTVWSDVKQDTCEMSYVTHDLELADRLDRFYRRYLDLHEKVSGKYKSLISNSQGKPNPQQNGCNLARTLTVIVSHPHGCSKQICLGYYTRKEKVGINWSQNTYTTATCPGSSGALVFILGRVWWGFGHCDHPHKGNCLENMKLNCSGRGID